jgi:hypothetical protein
MEMLKDFAINTLQRIRQALREVITWLNGLFTLIALYVMSNHDVNEKLLPFVPEDWRQVASVALPLLTFWIVQKGKEIDKARAAVQARLPGE